MLIVWPAAIFKLTFVKSYLFMAYLALARKGSWGDIGFFGTWGNRIASSPVEWAVIAFALILYLRRPLQKDNRLVYPILIYAVLILAATARVLSDSARYSLPFMPALDLFAAITLAPFLLRSADRLPSPSPACSWRAAALETSTASPPDRAAHPSAVLEYIRQANLTDKALLVPQNDVPMIHYYFPRTRLRGYYTPRPDAGRPRRLRTRRHLIPVSIQSHTWTFNSKNKTALVTGSTAGIGLAIAHALVKEGASVIVNGRTQLRVDEAVKKSGAAHGIAADLGTEAGAAQVIARFPTVDILVNNLGIFEPKPFDQIADDDWRRFFEVNVLSGVRLSRHYIRAMRKNNWGRIVFISSESALQIPAEMIHYGMTKTAQLAVSRGLAETTAGTAVTVNAVLPGPTASEGVVEFVDKLAKDQGTDRGSFEREFFRSARPSSIIQRFATPEEVAVAVAFVCSPLASAINGSALRVDGGVVRSIA